MIIKPSNPLPIYDSILALALYIPSSAVELVKVPHSISYYAKGYCELIMNYMDKHLNFDPVLSQRQYLASSETKGYHYDVMIPVASFNHALESYYRELAGNLLDYNGYRSPDKPITTIFGTTAYRKHCAAIIRQAVYYLYKDAMPSVIDGSATNADYIAEKAVREGGKYHPIKESILNGFTFKK